MLQSCAILLSLALLPCNGGITMSGPAGGSLSFASPPSKALPLSYFRTTSLRTYLPSVDASIYPLQLRGGREDSEVPLGLSSEEVEDEGTIQPGPGVKVEEGLVEKMKKNAEEDEDMWQQIRDVKMPTREEVIRDQEEYAREHPEEKPPVNSVLFFEIRQGNRTGIKKLIEQGGDPNARDKYGDCCIHLAAIDDNIPVLEDLVSLGADVNIANDKDNTALHIAAEFNQVEMMERLIELGANISAQNMVKATPLMTAAIHRSCEAVSLLAKHGADIHARSIKGSTPLHHAAGWGSLETVRTLISLGANVTAKTPLGRSAMDWAHYSNHTAVKAELAKHGAAVLDGGMRPDLELRKWAAEKERRSARREAGEVLDDDDPRREPLILAPIVRDPYLPGPVLKRESGPGAQRP